MNRFPKPPSHTPLIFPPVPTHAIGRPREYNPSDPYQASKLIQTIWNPIKSDDEKRKAYDLFLRIFATDWKNTSYQSPFSDPETVTNLLANIESLLTNTLEPRSVRKTYLLDIQRILRKQYENLMVNEFRKLHLGGKRKTRRGNRKMRKTRKTRKTRKH